MQRDPRGCFEWSRGPWGALVRTSCSLPSGCRSCWARCWTLWITCTNWTSSTGDQGARLLQEESTTSPWASLPVGGTEGGRCGPHSQDEGVHPPGAPPRLAENAPQQGTSRGSPAPRSCELRAGRGAGVSARAGSRHQPTQDGRSRRGHGRASLQSCGPRRNPRSRLWGSGKGFGSSRSGRCPISRTEATWTSGRTCPGLGGDVSGCHLFPRRRAQTRTAGELCGFLLVRFKLE